MTRAPRLTEIACLLASISFIALIIKHQNPRCRPLPVQARSAAESPAAVERRKAREAVGVARDARIAERKATKLAIEASQAAALAATQAAEAAAREVALKAEQDARDAEFTERPAR